MNLSDQLIDWLLESIALDASLFHVGQYCGNWRASTHGMARASFHLVTQGSCWLHIDDEGSQKINAGDAVFLLRDMPYCLSGESNAQIARTAPPQTMQPAGPRLEGAGVELACGFFHFESGLSELIIDALPRYLIQRKADSTASPTHAIFELILQETRRSQTSSPILEHLVDLLFLYALRMNSVVSNGELHGLLGIARSSQFAPLLGQLIANPQRNWSLEDMAQVAGMSRSAFFNRFSEIAGQAPGQVLLNLRMRVAAKLLQTATVAEAADAVGYQSIASFTRAFKKVTGELPGAWRRQAGKSTAAAERNTQATDGLRAGY